MKRSVPQPGAAAVSSEGAPGPFAASDLAVAAGRLGWTLWDCATDRYPPEWLGDHPHSHQAIDDARGYAHLLITLMEGGTAAGFER